MAGLPMLQNRLRHRKSRNDEARDTRKREYEQGCIHIFTHTSVHEYAEQEKWAKCQIWAERKTERKRETERDTQIGEPNEVKPNPSIFKFIVNKVFCRLLYGTIYNVFSQSVPLPNIIRLIRRIRLAYVCCNEIYFSLLFPLANSIMRRVISIIVIIIISYKCTDTTVRYMCINDVSVYKYIFSMDKPTCW